MNKISNECHKPELTIYHAKADGTGSGAAFSLHPAEVTGDISFDGFITLKMMKQIPHAKNSFDHANCREYKMGFNVITKMLQVFRGECESINMDKGIDESLGSWTWHFNVRHTFEPYGGYVITLVSRNEMTDKQTGRTDTIVLNSGEALGLSIAIENSLGLICFGVPKVLQLSGI